MLHSSFQKKIKILNLFKIEQIYLLETILKLFPIRKSKLLFLNFTSIFSNSYPEENKIALGIAPFSQHKGKMYPLEKIEEIIHYFYHKDIPIYIFGSEKEAEKIKEWQERYPKIRPVMGLPLVEVLQIIQKMKVILSMDSANLHFASLVTTPAVSVWEATHPYLGFYGWGQAKENIVRKNISCSPCSTFGNMTIRY